MGADDEQVDTVQEAAPPKAKGPSDKDKEHNTLPVDELANGPIMDRGCTDILCCLLFTVFLVVMVGIAGYGVTTGDPLLLITPFDPDGYGCGMNETTKDYPFLYFPLIDVQAASAANPSINSIAKILQYATCVKQCPSADKSTPVLCKPPNFMTSNTQFWQDCVYYVGGVSLPVKAPFRYDTTSFAGRFCLPNVDTSSVVSASIAEFQKTFEQYFGSGALQVVQDVVASRLILAGAIGAAFLLGFVYMIFLRFCGRIIMWLSILGIIGGSAYGGWMLWQIAEPKLDTDQYKLYYQIGAYVAWSFAGICFCCVCCNYRNIQIGLAVMQATAKFINGTPQVFFVPVFGLVALVGLLGACIVAAAYVASIGKIGPGPAPFTFLPTVTWSDEIRYALLYQLFGYLWLNAFFIGCTQFVVSAAAAVWYFTSTSDTNGSGSICTGYWWVARYHLGTIAFGSLLIAIVQMIRIIFEYYAQKLEEANPENPLVKALLCCTRCCLDCLERFIKFISVNAYIQCSITGKDFCSSAWNAFILILTNALRFGTAQSIGFIFVILGMAFIGCANAAGVYAVLHYVPQFKGLVTSWIGPCVVGGVIGLLMGQVFMSVYSFASDTILQCFMVDEELKRPDGLRPAELNAVMDSIAETSNPKPAE